MSIELVKQHGEWLKSGGEKPDLRYANLESADLRSANLRSANLRSANLRSANLRSADLSQSKGLLDAAEWLQANCEYDDLGLVCYKSFGEHYPAPESWEIEKGEIITDVPNANATQLCGCGVNVATKRWVAAECYNEVWECRVLYKDLPSVVVPYNTNGKFRASRVMLITPV